MIATAPLSSSVGIQEVPTDGPPAGSTGNTGKAPCPPRFAIRRGLFVLLDAWTSGAPQLRHNAEQIARSGVDQLAELHHAERYVAELLGHNLTAHQRCIFREAIRDTHLRDRRRRHSQN